MSAGDPGIPVSKSARLSDQRLRGVRSRYGLSIEELGGTAYHHSFARFAGAETSDTTFRLKSRWDGVTPPTRSRFFGQHRDPSRRAIIRGHVVCFRSDFPVQNIPALVECKGTRTGAQRCELCRRTRYDFRVARPERSRENDVGEDRADHCPTYKRRSAIVRATCSQPFDPETRGLPAGKSEDSLFTLQRVRSWPFMAV